jgi:lipid-binding SYLF domain-containing protein
MLIMNERGMKKLLSDKFTIGGEAEAAAGPVGREASARNRRDAPRGNFVLVAIAGLVCGIVFGGFHASAGRKRE